MSSPLFAVQNARLKIAMSLKINIFFTLYFALSLKILINSISLFTLSLKITLACFCVTPATPCYFLTKSMYCCTLTDLTGLPSFCCGFHLPPSPSSSNKLLSLSKYPDLKESYACLHPHSSLIHPTRFEVPS